MEDHSGVTLILSPVQLAALLQNQSLSPVGTQSNRLWGGADIIAGAVELIGAGALLIAPDPTAVTKIGGSLLAMHGIDTISTEVKKVLTGYSEKSLTSRASASAAHNLGLDTRTSGNIGMAVDIAVPVVVGGLLGALRVLSIRSGTINLLAEEAAGGHAIARHVGKSEAWLRARLAAETRIPAAASFRDMKEATSVIWNAIRVNSASIKAAMRAANVGGKHAFEHHAGKVIGYGIPRATDALQDMTKSLFGIF